MPDATHNSACLGCGYRLLSLRDDDACPECALSVAASRRGTLIDPEDTATRQAVRRGLGGLRVALVLPALLGGWMLMGWGFADFAAYYQQAPPPLIGPIVLATLIVAEGWWAALSVRRATATTERHPMATRAARRTRALAGLTIPMGVWLGAAVGVRA